MDDKPQIDKFKELARDRECDDDSAAFEDKVWRVATAPQTNPESDQ